MEGVSDAMSADAWDLCGTSSVRRIEHSNIAGDPGHTGDEPALRLFTQPFPLIYAMILPGPSCPIKWLRYLLGCDSKSICSSRKGKLRTSSLESITGLAEY